MNWFLTVYPSSQGIRHGTPDTLEAQQPLRSSETLVRMLKVLPFDQLPN